MNSKNWLVYSLEHNAYWKGTNMGYTLDKYEAGLYSFEAAKTIVEEANRYIAGNLPNEVMLPYFGE